MDTAGLNALFRSVEGPNEQMLTIGNYTLLSLAISMIVTWAWPTAVAICRDWQYRREDRRMHKLAEDLAARRLYAEHHARMNRERLAIDASWEAARSPAWLV